MANISMTGKIPCQIDYAFSITATRISVRESTPTTVKKGAFGPIGTAQGVSDVTGQATFCIPAAGLEFNWDALKSKEGGFTFSFSYGTSTKGVLGCRVSERSFSNDPGSGDATFDVSFTGTEMIDL